MGKIVLALLLLYPAASFASMDDYFGQWNAAYSGSDTGTCSLTIGFITKTRASVNGVCTSIINGTVVSVSGDVVEADKDDLLSMTASNGAQFSAGLDNQTGSGQWSNSTLGQSGSWSANLVGQPFQITCDGEIGDVDAVLSTAILFNVEDVGKAGEVFSTAWAPAGGLAEFGISSANLDRSMRVTVADGNPYLDPEVSRRQESLEHVLATDPNAFVLVQLTTSGWQLVVDGQLLPYASGILGDAIAALNILNGANSAILAGTQICVGYGTSAAEMIAAGRMMQIATIPGANATTGGNCIVESGGGVTDQAIEFYKSDIDHYFMTAYSDEATSLDNNTAWNWVRTGETYNVWLTQASAPSNASPVCRFYGVFANGTMGSHFYTIDTDECEYVKSRTDWGWGYEGFAFYAVKPVGGACPSGTSPIYRAYNNGMGGAPNHRYMTSLSTLNTMVSNGWVSEGLVFCGSQ